MPAGCHKSFVLIINLLRFFNRIDRPVLIRLVFDFGAVRGGGGVVSRLLLLCGQLI